MMLPTEQILAQLAEQSKLIALLNQQLGEHVASDAELQDHIVADLKAIRDDLQIVIYGDIKGAGVGILTRVDRLERTEQNRGKAVWALWLSLIGVFVKYLYELIVAGRPH